MDQEPGKVVSLRGEPIPDGAPAAQPQICQPLVDDLEWLLAEAKSGRVTCLCYAAMQGNGDCRMQVVGASPGMVVVGAVDLLHKRVQDLTMQGAQYSR